ncbi:MAG: hypothetical protein VX777_05490 [Chlamydiota bacterium]|nr:hypothetical protein [Chlamydiota bacterium]
MYKICFIATVFLLSSCSSSSPDTYRDEGRSINKSIVKQLQKIHSRSDLIDASTELEGLFNKLVDVMIQSRKYQESGSLAETLPLSKNDHLLSDKLREELNRIYRIPGAKKLIEKSQQSALTRLDIYEQQLNKRKTQVPVKL